MTKGDRKASGILAFIGGSVTIASGFFFILSGIGDLTLLGITSMIFSVLILVGGILLVRDVNVDIFIGGYHFMTTGGILAIFGGGFGLGMSAVFFWLTQSKPYLSHLLSLTPVLFTCYALALASGIWGIYKFSHSHQN